MDRIRDREGVVVEEVGEGSALSRSGLRPGDVLTSWERPPSPPARSGTARGRIESVFDWMWLEAEKSPRGIVRLVGERQGERRLFDVPPGRREGRLRPAMPEAALQAYLAGKSPIDLLRSVDPDAPWALRCWLHLQVAEARIGKRDWDGAHAAYRSALKIARGPWARAIVRRAAGAAYEKQGEIGKAEEAFRSALRENDKIWGGNMFRAGVLNDMNRLAWQRLDEAEALEYSERARVVLEKLAPHSLEMATNLIYRAHVARARDNLDLAEELVRRALGIASELAPDSLDVASVLIVSSSIPRKRGLLGPAEKLAGRALEIQTRRAPDSLHVAKSLLVLGNIAIAKNDLKQAEEYLAQSLHIAEKLRPQTLDEASVYKELGRLAEIQDDFELAENHWRRALSIQQKCAPGSRHVASLFQSLGILNLRRRDFDLAEFYYGKALELSEVNDPDDVGGTLLYNLGWLAEARGRLTEAEDYLEKRMEKKDTTEIDEAFVFHKLAEIYSARRDWDKAQEYAKRSLAIRRRLSPNTLDEMYSLETLGQIAMARNNPELAKRYIERALKITNDNSIEKASNLYSLAVIHLGLKRSGKAIEYFDGAIEVLERMVLKVGGSHHVKAGYRARYAPYYRKYAELLLEEARPDEAFAILERSRAASFLAMLAERKRVSDDELPKEHAQERRRLEAEYDRIEYGRRRLDRQQDLALFDTLSGKLRELRQKLDSLDKQDLERLRSSSPELTALSRTLDFQQAREVLDPGTVLLSYSVGEESSHVFVVEPAQSLRVERLALGREELKGAVAELRRLIGKGLPGSPESRNLMRQGRRLYRTLIEPVAHRMSTAKRVLIVPDGPLHKLPFGALVREKAEPAAERWEYLIEWKPIHLVLSATVYSEITKSRRPGRRLGGALRRERLIAFGDPHYPQLRRARVEEIDDHEISRAIHRGAEFRPLPFTRHEVERIVRLFPRSSRAYLGPQATEEQAKASASEARFLHFATHGYVDEVFPLNSGLALTIPEEHRIGQDNGLLQAWEVIGRLRLDAEMVVLSACASGLGKEVGGDGLTGLVRAFQIAGARSVIASQWNVADRATAELMVRFYQHLAAGQSKDEALRAAQLELIGATDFSAPHFWAAFQVYGDWQ